MFGAQVGDSGLRDLPDRLVWGGVGMRMDANIEHLLRRCWPFQGRITSGFRPASGPSAVRSQGLAVAT